jgi:Zn-finger nucleic acid-binding protein
MPTIDHPPIPCPSCRQPMEKAAFDRQLGGALRLDLCYPCHAIWFDRNESMQLAPAAVIELFRQIHRHEGEPRYALKPKPACPRCRAELVRTQDLTKSGRFSYYRCAAGHGRMTPFFEFLREKHFVRSLNAGELHRLRAQVKQVRCSGCGAPIDLHRDLACGFCKAPVAVLDADAVEKALKQWSDAAATRPLPSRERIEAAMAEARGVQTPAHAGSRVGDALQSIDGVGTIVDLVDTCIGGLGELLSGVELL